MSKYPIVLVVSEGSVTPKDVIKNLRNLPDDEDTESLGFFPSIGANSDGTTLIGHIFNLVTKYYTTDLYLVPFDDDISSFPAEMRDSIEGVLIYFDSGKRNFSQRIPVYAKFLKCHEIEMGILLCDRLYDDSNEGITYKEAKQESRFLDVIELGRKKCEDDEDDPHDPKGYDELHQALRSVIWSNINVSEMKPINFPILATSPTDTIEEKVKFQQANESTSEKTDNSVETELELFEKLLGEMMAFKEQTTNWPRNERLTYAEKFAEKFDKLLDDCIDSSDDDDDLTPSDIVEKVAIDNTSTQEKEN